MADDQNVNAGSETSGDQAEAVTSQEETAETGTTAETTEQSAATAENAGGAAEASTGAYVQDEDEKAEGETSVTPDSDKSRTDFVTNARPGDECTCPDGRKGTVHKFDEGLVCIPNHEQGN
jgi:hypothetical protein